MATDDRIHLIVLYGGRSAEHDVSCTSAAHVLRAADPAKYRITPVGISRDGVWSIATAAQAALADGSHALPSQLDPHGTEVSATPLLSAAAAEDGRTVVVPLLHGPMGEDGTVQGLLELLDVAYVGSGVLSSALCMDKAMAKHVAGAAGIPQGRYRVVREHEATPGLAGRLADELGLPVFVKPANMGSSIGVSKARTVAELQSAIDLALTYDEWIVVEEAILGREIEVAVLGNLQPQASVPGEVVPGADFYDYADKYLDDGSRTLIPAPLPDDVTEHLRALAIDAFLTLRCEGLARVDFFYEDGPDGRGPLLNEVNSIPGFTPISMYPKMWLASGMTYPELIDRLVDLALERHARRRRNTAR